MVRKITIIKTFLAIPNKKLFSRRRTLFTSDKQQPAVVKCSFI